MSSDILNMNGALFVKLDDSTFQPVMDITGVEIETEDPVDSSMPALVGFKAGESMEFSATFDAYFPKHFIRKYVYRWYAKGPIRHRARRRAWEQYIRAVWRKIYLNGEAEA